MRKGRETKPCNSIPDRPSHSIPMAEVKEPKEAVGGITIDVDCKGIDEALEKARELVGVLEEIDRLQNQITKGAERVEQIANRCLRVKRAADHEVTDRPKESYAEWSKNQCK